MDVEVKKKRRSPRHRSPVDELPEEKITIALPHHHKKTIAAQLLGEDRLPDRKIAEIVGVSRRALSKWKLDPAFQDDIRHHADIYIKKFATQGLAQKEKRLAILNDVHDRLMTSVKERGDDPGMDHVPGGHTGLVAKTYRGVGKGRKFRLIEEFKIDTPVVRSLLDIHEAVREETGQNKQRMEITGPNGEPLMPPQINIQVVSITRDAHGRAMLEEEQHETS